MYFCRSWFSNRVSFRCVLVVLNFFIDEYWILKQKYFIFHEMTLKLYFMKCLERNISQCILPFKDIRISNMNKFIFGHMNINSLRNKFDLFSEQVKGSIDILMLFETKLDDSFPEAQFLIEGFHSPFRFDRNINGGGIMLYVRKDIPTKLLNHDFQGVESVFVEMNLF